MAIANWTCVSWVAYVPGTIAVNVTWINAGQTPRSMYPSIFNRFPVIQTVKSKVRNFSTFCAHFGLPWGRPWDNRGKCHMDEKRIQCLSNARSVYPSIFNRFPVIQPVSSKVRHFSTFCAHFGLPWVRPWENRGKCYMDRKRIQCWSKAS